MTTQARVEELIGTARALLRMAHEQRAALEAGELDRFDRLLEERTALFERLGVDDSSRAARLGAEFAAAPEAARTAVLTALEDVARMDAEHEALITSERRGILSELPALDAGRRAAAAYRSSTHAAYVDTAS